MSFNTFNLFNFFQQPNTGKHKILEDETEASKARNPSINNSGAVADFNWFFPYARKAIPNAIIQARGVKGFPIILFSDSRETADLEQDSILGIRYANFQTIFSGKISEDSNSSIFNYNLSGKIIPKELDESELDTFISGSITGEPLDRSISILTISGASLNAKHYYNYFNNYISGTLSGIFFDFSNIKTIFSGIIESGNLDVPIFENKINGNFVPFYKDTANLEYSLISYSTDQREVFDRLIEDEIEKLTYSLESYQLNQ